MPLERFGSPWLTWGMCMLISQEAQPCLPQNKSQI